jgi:hypothetical protein
MTSSTGVQPASGTRRAGSSCHDLEDRAPQIDCGRTRDILHSAAVISCGAALYNTAGGPGPVGQPCGNAAIVGRPERDTQTSDIR